MIPAPAWHQPPRGDRSHRISYWRSAPDGWRALTRCGLAVVASPRYTAELDGTVTGHPTLRVCRVCVRQDAIEALDRQRAIRRTDAELLDLHADHHELVGADLA